LVTPALKFRLIGSASNTNPINIQNSASNYFSCAPSPLWVKVKTEFAKQMWSQMNDYCADWVKGVKAKWPHKVSPKEKNKRDMGDKIY
jgi:hypothetical protein